MKTNHPAYLRATTVLILANGVLWLVFVIHFVVVSQPYAPHEPQFEEFAPAYIFWGRAYPFEQYCGSWPMRATRLLERPSFYAAIPVNYFFSRRGITVDHLYGGVSAGGYYLIAVFLTSFLQWYLVGLIVDHLRRRLSVSRAGVSPNPDHT